MLLHYIDNDVLGGLLEPVRDGIKVGFTGVAGRTFVVDLHFEGGPT